MSDIERIHGQPQPAKRLKRSHEQPDPHAVRGAEEWQRAFEEVSKDQAVFRAFVHAYQFRRQREWLTESARNEETALEGALRSALAMVFRPPARSLPADEQPIEIEALSLLRKTFKSAAARVLQSRTPGYLNAQLDKTGDRSPEEFIRHALRNYAADRTAGAFSPDPW